MAINDGKGHFSIQPLPNRVQLSSINAICVTDINGDKQPDLITGGNLFDFPPQFGRLDGSYGDVLLNDGTGTYRWIEPSLSGLRLTGAIKDIKEINTKKGRTILVTQNNQQPVVYSLKK